MPIDINKHEVDIDTLFKQNENDLCSIKELYRKLKELYLFFDNIITGKDNYKKERKKIYSRNQNFFTGIDYNFLCLQCKSNCV